MISIEHINREELFAIPLPTETDSYTPVSNKFILDTIDYMAKTMGLSLEAERFNSAKQGNMVVGNLNYEGTDPDMGLKIAFKNSYDKSRSFSIAAGSTVWVCLNGMIHGQIVMNRVHTGEARSIVRQQIHMAFEAMIEEYNRMITIRSELKETPMLREEAQAVVANLFFQEETISSVMLNIIKTEWNKQNSNFAPINSQYFTAWDCYNHITESLKRSHPSDYINNHISVHKAMSEFLVISKSGTKNTTLVSEETINTSTLFDNKIQDIEPMMSRSVIILP